jgi:penicillin-binding protein 1A
VLAVDAEGATIGLADQKTGRIPFEELKWARKPLEEARVGPPPSAPGDVLAPEAVILVEPLKPDAAAKAKAGPPLYGLRQIPAISGAVIALDPHTGRVLAMAGGFSYEASQFNRAIQAKRQTGSAIKPFVYTAALDHGYTPSSIVLDAPLTVEQGPGLPAWTPANYTHKFYGPLPLRVGVEQSRNLITARLGIAVGLDAVGSYIERFGIMDKMPREYSMLLGAGETTVLRLTTAYAMLVNGGKRITPTFIDRVQDRYGATIYRADLRPCEGCTDVEWNNQPPPELPDRRQQVVDARTAYQMVHILEGVIDRGTGHVIASLGKPLAGKTGTTNDSLDTWFVGFAPDLVFGVFVGFDTPQTLGLHETGASASAPIFKQFMGEALKNTPGTPFRVPPGIRLVRVNATTGQLARPGDRNVIFEAFKPGTEPKSDEPAVTNVGIVGEDDPEESLPVAPVNEIGSVVPATQGTAPAPAAATLPTRSVPASGTGGLY